MEQATPIGATSWIVELPWDLGLSENYSSSVATTTEIPTGWNGATNLIPQWSRLDAPIKRIRFRRAYVSIGMPTEATDRTFGELQDLRGLSRLQYRVGLWRLSRKGVREWKTVCQLTRWYGGSAIPGGMHREVELRDDARLRTELLDAIGDLNLWLQAYALTAGEFRVGAIDLGLLPSLIPWVTHQKAAPDASIAVSTGMVRLHTNMPDLIPSSGSEAGAKAGTRLFAGQRFPLFDGVSLIFEGQRHSLSGSPRQSVIDLGTGVEGVVSQVVRAAGKAQGRQDDEIGALLGKRWKDIYHRDLLQALGVQIGRGGSAHSAWWRDVYDLRIRAVHLGERPTQAEADDAVNKTWDLLEWMAERLSNSAELRDLGNALRITRE